MNPLEELNFIDDNIELKEGNDVINSYFEFKTD